MKTSIIIFLVLLASGQRIHARGTPAWPYERLFAEADAVVFAKAISNQDTADESEPKGYIGVNEEMSAQPEYLLFLKRRTDGRYEPISGQMDAALSVREVAEPSWTMSYDE